MNGISGLARMLPSVVLCFAAAQAQPPETAAGATGPVLQEGTPVALAFFASLTSKTAVKGAPVGFVLVNDLVVAGVTVAKAGSKALGHVAYVRPAAVPGRSGALSLVVDYLEVGAGRVKLRASKERSGEDGIEYSNPYRLKWPMGLLRTGDDVQIKQGTVLAVYVAEDTTL